MHAEMAYLFRHALMRDAAYQLHPPADRAVLHKLALRVLEELLPPDALNELAEELADHAHDALAAASDSRETAELGGREVSYLLKAGENAAAQYAADRAVTLLTRAAALPGCDGASRFRALVAAGNARIVEGRFTDARELFERVRVESLPARESAEWHLRLAEVDLRTGRYPEVLERAATALEAAQAADHGGLQARALAMQASAHMLSGKHDEALAEYEQALQLARQHDDPVAASQAEVNSASILRRRGRHAEAEPILRRAVASFSKTGHARNLAIAQQNLSNLMYDLRRMDEAEQWLSTAEATYRRVGDRNGIANITGSRGIQYHFEGDIEKAASAYRLAAELFREVDAPRGEMRNVANLGTALAVLGRLDEATTMAERALALARQIGDRESEGVYIGQRGVAHKLGGRFDEALADLRASVAIGDIEVGARSPQVIVNYCHLCDLLRQLGDETGARKVAERAWVVRKDVPPEGLNRDPDARKAMEVLEHYKPGAGSP